MWLERIGTVNQNIFFGFCAVVFVIVVLVIVIAIVRLCGRHNTIIMLVMLYIEVLLKLDYFYQKAHIRKSYNRNTVILIEQTFRSFSQSTLHRTGIVLLFRERRTVTDQLPFRAMVRAPVL